MPPKKVGAKRPKNAASLKAAWRSLEDITVDPMNARQHDDAQLDKIRSSIRQFGQVWPILIDESGKIVAHHGVFYAMLREGFTEAKVIVTEGMTDDQRRAFALADNRLAELSTWDEETLRAELLALQSGEFALQAVGYDESELEALFEIEAKVNPDGEDDLPPDTDVIVSKPGDLWEIGQHRVLCGDATNREDVHRVMGEAKPFLMVTDPPYGVNYKPQWRNQILNGSVRRKKIENDDRSDWREAWALFNGDVAYVWHGGIAAASVSDSLTACEFEIRSQIIWNKNTFACGRSNYHWKHEPCWYAVRKGKTANWLGGRKQSTVWDIAKNQKQETGHATQKPVECMRRPIANHTKKGEAIYDPFVGSGTTLIAAQTIGRVGIGIDLDPGWVDMTCRRLSELTGEAAVLVDDGRAFEEIMKARAPKKAARKPRSKAKEAA